MTEKRGNWKSQSSRVVYENEWIRVIEDKVIRPDGNEGIYGYLEKVPGVFIIARETDGSIYLVQEFRYPVKENIWQFPGGVAQSDDFLEEAKRELEEETGIRAGKLEFLGESYVAPGHETTKSEFVLATELDTSNMRLSGQEGDEDIRQIMRVGREELKEMVKRGDIKCGVTLAALQLLAVSEE